MCGYDNLLPPELYVSIVPQRWRRRCSAPKNAALNVYAPPTSSCSVSVQNVKNKGNGSPCFQSMTEAKTKIAREERGKWQKCLHKHAQ